MGFWIIDVPCICTLYVQRGFAVSTHIRAYKYQLRNLTNQNKHYSSLATYHKKPQNITDNGSRLSQTTYKWEGGDLQSIQQPLKHSSPLNSEKKYRGQLSSFLRIYNRFAGRVSVLGNSGILGSEETGDYATGNPQMTSDFSSRGCCSI